MRDILNPTTLDNLAEHSTVHTNTINRKLVLTSKQKLKYITLILDSFSFQVMFRFNT